MNVRRPLNPAHLALLAGLVLPACVDGVDAPPAASASRPIVSGQPTTGSPATVSVGGFCSGTLISPKVVLTAAHCLEGESLQTLNVFFGSDVNGQGTWIKPVHFEQHPSSDIGCITLEQAGPVEPVPALGGALGSLDTHVGDAVHIVGFGVTSENGEDYGLKREGMTKLERLDGDTLFTGSDLNGSWTCYGDSGGPNYMTIGGKEVVAGVTSFGTTTCGMPEDGAVRTDVTYTWIAGYVAAHDGAAGGTPDAGPTPPPGTPDAGPDNGGGGDDDGGGGGGCGCRVGGDVDGGASLGGLALLAGVALVLARRRR